MSSGPFSPASVCEAYSRAIYEKDVAGFLALYHPSARVFDTWGVWSYEGSAQRTSVIENWFSSLGSERVKATFDRLETSNSAEMSFLTARVTYAALSSEGVELRQMSNRITWILKPEGSSLRIAHEHTSVPIGFPELKGLLNL